MISNRPLQRIGGALLVAALVVPAVMLTTVPAQQAPALPKASDACRSVVAPATCSAAETSGRAASRSTPVVVWTDLNDGTGSGLDADVLDGISSEAFLSAIAEARREIESLRGGVQTLRTEVAAARAEAKAARPEIHRAKTTGFGFCCDGQFGWRDVTPFRIENLVLAEGDVVRVTVTGGWTCGGSPDDRVPSVGFAFNGNLVGPTMGCGGRSMDAGYGQSATALLAVKASGGDLAPGKYTAQVRAFQTDHAGHFFWGGSSFNVEILRAAP